MVSFTKLLASVALAATAFASVSAVLIIPCERSVRIGLDCGVRACSPEEIATAIVVKCGNKQNNQALVSKLIDMKGL